MHRQWKQEQVSQEEYRDLAQLCREIVRKAKAQLELIWRSAKNNKKFLQVCQPEKKCQRPCTLPINMTGKLVTRDEEKADVFNHVGQDR